MSAVKISPKRERERRERERETDLLREHFVRLPIEDFKIVKKRVGRRRRIEG
jgi:hypothetical protein